MSSNFWLQNLANEISKKIPNGEITISSGVSPSGKYHVGTLREVLTAEAIARQLVINGRKSKHVHIVDDLDVLRKIPEDVPEEFSQNLGKSLCDVPAPDGSKQSYSEYYLQDLIDASKRMNLKMEIVRSSQKYRSGFFGPAIEKALDKSDEIQDILENISGHSVSETWSPVQVNEEGYLKNRQFVSINKSSKTIDYLDRDNSPQSVSYEKGDVKLNWRIDWPARWWLMGVDVEPFGRDHATTGGSYDTGKELARVIFNINAPIPVPFHFINRTGETKKMSKSAGNVITAKELVNILPPEMIWYFILRFPPQKQLFFNESHTLIKLFDEFASLQAKEDKTESESQLLAICNYEISELTISNIPLTHLIASYQASLRDKEKTIEVISRTEHASTALMDKEVIHRELDFVDSWLESWAPDDVKFSILEDVDPATLTDNEKEFLSKLADKLEAAPEDIDGSWIHQCIYEFKDELSLNPAQLFRPVYMVLIGKESGPRAGWFLSLLDKGWLIKRLRLQA